MRHLLGGKYEARSAGIEAHGLNHHAVQVMQEAGVDISGQQSNTVDEFPGAPADYVISVCGHADEHCPVLPAAVKKLHHGFDDPPKLAATAKTEDEALLHYRRVRDEIREFVRNIDAFLEQ